MTRMNAHQYVERHSLDELNHATTDAEIADLAAGIVKHAAEADAVELDVEDVKWLLSRWRAKDQHEASMPET
jgi:hypothetical protein